MADDFPKRTSIINSSPNRNLNLNRAHMKGESLRDVENRLVAAAGTG